MITIKTRYINHKIKYLLSALTFCKIKVYCCIVLHLHMAYTKFHKNRPRVTRVTRWSTLKTLNRVFSISQKWDLPGYSTASIDRQLYYDVTALSYSDVKHY